MTELVARVAVALESSPDQVVSPRTTWHMFMAFLTEMAEKAKRIREQTGEKTADDFSVEDLPAAAQAIIDAHPDRKDQILKEFADMRTSLEKAQPKKAKT